MEEDVIARPPLPVSFVSPAPDRSWSTEEKLAVMNAFFSFDPTLDRWDRIRDRSGVGRTYQELKFFCMGLLQSCLRAADQSSRRLFEYALDSVYTILTHRSKVPYLTGEMPT